MSILYFMHSNLYIPLVGSAAVSTFYFESLAAKHEEFTFLFSMVKISIHSVICTVSTNSHCHLDFGLNDVGDIWCA